ncbi:hypothetical protein [Rudaea sp.]|uniref:hypothetical protein n=1 Tax=Rudaea sp. TaxID=2136325 RepID=UPI002ED4CE8F
MLKTKPRASVVRQYGILSARNFGFGRAIRAVLGLILVLGVFATAGIARAAKPEIDPTYADGQTYYMIGPHMIVGAMDTQPNLYAHSQELYLLSYPIPAGGGAPVFASGYTPQCNPCFHPGLPPPFVFHDHVVTGAPGLGKNGTAGEFKGPWKVIVLQYVDSVLTDPNFVPAKSAADVDLYEAQGKFKLLNGGLTHGDNPFEIETGNVLICPLVSPNA